MYWSGGFSQTVVFDLVYMLHLFVIVGLYLCSAYSCLRPLVSLDPAVAKVLCNAKFVWAMEDRDTTGNASCSCCGGAIGMELQMEIQLSSAGEQ